MARVELICGRVCAGKTTYARALAARENAVLLSCDEAVRALEDVLCDDYDTALEAVKKYLHRTASAIARAGCTAVLDWGFWTRAERRAASDFYEAAGVSYRWHYIDVPDEEWKARIAGRNAAVSAGEEDAYYVDAGLLAKLQARFEAPQRDEIDCWQEE